MLIWKNTISESRWYFSWEILKKISPMSNGIDMSYWSWVRLTPCVPVTHMLDVSQIKLTVIQHCCSQRFGRWTPEKPRKFIADQAYSACLSWFCLDKRFFSKSPPPIKGLLLAEFLPWTVSVAFPFSNDHSFGIRKSIARQMPEAILSTKTHTKAFKFTRNHQKSHVQTCSRLNSRDWLEQAEMYIYIYVKIILVCRFIRMDSSG